MRAFTPRNLLGFVHFFFRDWACSPFPCVTSATWSRSVFSLHTPADNRPPVISSCQLYPNRAAQSLECSPSNMIITALGMSREPSGQERQPLEVDIRQLECKRFFASSFSQRELFSEFFLLEPPRKFFLEGHHMSQGDSLPTNNQELEIPRI